MANFENDKELVAMIKRIESFANNEEIYTELISEGQNIMKSEIQSGASKHIKTGKMASSLKKTKPKRNSNGEWVGRVKFFGSSGVYTAKSGKKYDITNWLKAFRIEYGTSKQKANPFVRPAIEKSESVIRKKWNEIYERELKDLQ